MAERRLRAAEVEEVVDPGQTDSETEDSVDNAESKDVKEYKSSTEKKDRIPLFTIDDVEYTVPANPGLTVSLRFLDALRRDENEMMAGLELMEAMLGKKAYRKFLEWEDLNDGVISDVLDQCIELAIAKTENKAKK